MAIGRLEFNTVMGLLASVLLAAGKLVAGIVGHSSALVADAVESFADTVGSVVVLQGLRVASRPPDNDHPYGYGKAEALAALAVGAMLLVAAGVIVLKAVEEMTTPHAAPAPWTLLVLVIVIAVKEMLFRVVLKNAEEFASDAAKADAWHHRSDAVTSAAAFIGVAVAIWGPRWLGMPRLVLADEVAAMIASVVIVITGVRLMRPSMRELLDRSSQEMSDRVRAAARTVEGVVLVEKVHTRKSGRGYCVDMHLHVDPEMSVRDAHSLAGRVKGHVRAAIPSVAHVLIHVEPGERSGA